MACEVIARRVCDVQIGSDVSVVKLELIEGCLYLIVGTRDGQLLVFGVDGSGRSKRLVDVAAPLRAQTDGLGCVAALAVGRLFNADDAPCAVCTVATDGRLHAFALPCGDGERKSFEPCLVQLLHANISAAHVLDVDGDGACELLVAMTDRVVRTYRFVADGPAGWRHRGRLVALNKWELPTQIVALSARPANLLLSQTGCHFVRLRPGCDAHDSADCCAAFVYSAVSGASHQATPTAFAQTDAATVDLFHVLIKRLLVVDQARDVEASIQLPADYDACFVAPLPHSFFGCSAFLFSDWCGRLLLYKADSEENALVYAPLAAASIGASVAAVCAHFAESAAVVAAATLSQSVRVRWFTF